MGGGSGGPLETRCKRVTNNKQWAVSSIQPAATESNIQPTVLNILTLHFVPRVHGGEYYSKASPLGSIKASPDSGKVLILFDCNTYGETDSKPHLRVVPINRSSFDKLLKGVLQGRQHTSNPESMAVGDIYMCMDAGKERRRLFTNPLKVPTKGQQDPNRNVYSKIMLHCTEDSVRKRRGIRRGAVKLTQGIHILRNYSTTVVFNGSFCCILLRCCLFFFPSIIVLDMTCVFLFYN